MLYLLDTNIISDLVRNPNGAAAKRYRLAGEENVCTSIIVAGEVRFGLEKKSSREKRAKAEALLDAMKILPLEAPADRQYGVLRAVLENAGTPIGGNDLLIATQAMMHGCTMVTDNVREFSRVPGLTVENWLR